MVHHSFASKNISMNNEQTLPGAFSIMNRHFFVNRSRRLFLQNVQGQRNYFLWPLKNALPSSSMVHAVLGLFKHNSKGQ